MFLWSARTLANALREHLPKTASLLEQIAAAFGTRNLRRPSEALSQMREHQRRYAVLEPRSAKGEQASNLFLSSRDFGWNDLGSWTALHEHHIAKNHPLDDNVVTAQDCLF